MTKKKQSNEECCEPPVTSCPPEEINICNIYKGAVWTSRGRLNQKECTTVPQNEADLLVLRGFVEIIRNGSD